MPAHVAILQPPYPRMILRGEKTLECRLTRTRIPPYAMVSEGDPLYLKRSGGPFVAAAEADRVACYQGLTPADLDVFHRRLNDRIRGSDEFWRTKRSSRYATFIGLRRVVAIDEGPVYPPNPYRAWFVLPAPAEVLEVEVTQAGLRHRYVPVGNRADFFEHNPIILVLPDGRCVRTELVGRTRLRWRGWGELFRAYHMNPGDRIRFAPEPGGRYRVSFHPQPHRREP